MKYIFIDSNILIHFKEFESIDWLEEISGTECTIVIAPIVIDELDRKKIGTDKLSNRARKALIKIEALSEKMNSEIRSHVFIEIVHKKPTKALFRKYDLNADEPDQRLIGTILQFKIDRKTDEVLLCTNDIGPRLRAKPYNIGSIKLNEKYLIPHQISELEKKLKQLEDENRMLKNSIPVVSLHFEGNKKFLEFKRWDKKSVDENSFIETSMKELKSKYPLLEIEDMNQNLNAIAQLAKSLGSPSEEQVKNYNSKLFEYFEEYKRWLKEFYKYKISKTLTFRIALFISNTGTKPAEDLDINLHFPDGFELYDNSSIPNIQSAPNPPFKPTSKLDFGKISVAAVGNSKSSHKDANFNFNRPIIKKTNSYDVNFPIATLKHGITESLEELLVVFANTDMVKNFKIDYKLNVANIPKVVEGKLNIKFI